MNLNWNQITKLKESFSEEQKIIIKEVTFEPAQMNVSGQIAPPQLAHLSTEDQFFIGAFIKSHGNIKQMEKIFGVSYPTIKARLNKIAEAFSFLDISIEHTSSVKTSSKDVLSQLESGDLTAEEALKELKK